MYRGSMRLLALEGATPPNARVELWRTHTAIASDGGATDHQTLIGSAEVLPSADAVEFEMGPADLQPVAATESDFIALTVRVADFEAPVFQAGRLRALPNPGGAGDVADTWLVGWRDLTDADLAAALPQVPMRVDDQTTVDDLSLRLGEGRLTLRAVGRAQVTPATPLTGAVTVGFTYSVGVTIEPASLHLPMRSLWARPLDDGRLVFSGAGVASAAAAALLGLLAGHLAREMLPGVMDRINGALEVSVVRRAVEGLAGAGAALPPGGGLPDGVWITIPGVTIRSSAMTVWSALNSFGSLRDRLLPAAADGGASPLCVVTALATLLPPGAVPLLRHFRDSVLARSDAGTALIAIYSRHAPRLVACCRDDPAFRAMTLRFLLRLLAAVAVGPARLDWVARAHAARRAQFPAALATELDGWLREFGLRGLAAPGRGPG